MSGTKKSDILYLFDRPAEPVYVPKGENKVAFDVPANYLVSKQFGLIFLSRVNIEPRDFKNYSAIDIFVYKSEILSARCTSNRHSELKLKIHEIFVG